MESYRYKHGLFVPIYGDRRDEKGHCAFVHPGQIAKKEGLFWLNTTKLMEAANNLSEKEREEARRVIESGKSTLVNLAYGSVEEWRVRLERESPKKKRVHLLALGDVGSTILTALKLLGGDVIHTLGIFDVSETVCKRWEGEMNQCAYPWDYDAMPPVVTLKEEELFQCDFFIFCASKGIPPVGAEVQDVRMAQFCANKEIISHFAKKARAAHFQGTFAVVSDPVDPLCKAAFLASNEKDDGTFDGLGLFPEQIQGYGLGVMNARGAYFAKKDVRFQSFLSEGRAYGPHGQDLVLANSIVRYDDALSAELTKLAIEANLRTRDLGFKPFVAPAISSAAISILLTLRGEWHYSSNFLGGVYMGCKNRTSPNGLEIEHLPLPEKLYSRLEKAFQGLEEIL